MDISGGLARWFQYSNTGLECKDDDHWETHCAGGPRSGTFCTFDGSYGVWDMERMNCDAYGKLRDTAISTCSRFVDCACGVYATGFNGMTCLIATFSYHLSGTAVVAPNGAPAEPEEPGFNYSGHIELRRDDSAAKGRSADVADGDKVKWSGGQYYYPYPFVQDYNAEGAPKTWSMNDLGTCEASYDEITQF